MTTAKGSNWIKCDLHVHTPASFFHGYGDKEQDTTWEKFIAELEALPPEFKMLGINDYLTIDGYKRLHTEKANGRLANIECLLPVVEFRLNRLVGEGKTKRLNYHVIFSDMLDISIIETQFLQALSSTYTLESGSSEPTWSGLITDESLIALGNIIKGHSPANVSLQAESAWQVGFNNFNVDYAELNKILARPQFAGKVLTAVGKSEWDDYRWDGGGAAEKRTIINETDIVFLSSDSVVQHEKNRDALSSNSVNSNLLDCSDAHYYSDSTQKDRIGNCYTWLKIEPSFSGLRQILFEPKGRICISETHPNTKAPYQVIQSARFLSGGEHFTDATISFSPYLNSIIGGKSTGKSLLAGLIVKTCDPEEYKKRKGEQKTGDDLEWIKQKESAVDFEVTWSDGAVSKLNSNAGPRKITYFPQHYLNSKINDKGVGTKELNKIIRVILSQTHTYAEAFSEYESALRRIDADIAAQCSNLESELRDLRQMKHTTQEKGKSADIRANVEKLKLEFAELNKQFGLTEEDLGIHSALSDLTKALTDSSAEIAANIEVMASIDKAELLEILAPGEILSQEFESLSEAVVTKLTARLTPVLSTAVEAISVILAEELNLEKARQKEIAAKIAANNKEHAPILEKIKNSAPLRAKSTQIKDEQTKLDEVIILEGRIFALEQEILRTATDLKNYAAAKLESALIVTSKIEEQPFSKGDDQLGIEITSRCKAEHIQGILKARIKYQSNPAIRAFLDEDAFSDVNTTGYTERLNEIIDQAVAGKIEPKADHKIFSVIQELLSNAIYLNYDLKLGGDSFVIMSPGKRALALLRVLVELDTSQHPIILDQPEDDLDNRSIYEGLATYIKAKKDHRQIIVVTHNPNVVVGADSEYVIVANQSGQESNQDNRRYRFEYIYGGLENSFLDDSTQYVLEKQGVREHVCEILDGGQTAFVRREQLYSGRKKRKWIN